MWAYNFQITKNGKFWYKFSPEGKFWKSIEKLECMCTTTNLPLCNVTIIVLKITLLRSVSVFTDLEIPKRDKEINKNKTKKLEINTHHLR